MQKGKKATKRNRLPERRNATEVMYALAGWLTSRDQPLIFSGHHDAAPIAEILREFVKVNRLPKAREGYPKLKTPIGTGHITNAHQLKATTPPRMTPHEALRSIMRIILELGTTDQNTVLAGQLEQLKAIRTERLETARKQQLGSEIDARIADDQMNTLDRIMRGDVQTIYMGSHIVAQNASNGNK